MLAFLIKWLKIEWLRKNLQLPGCSLTNVDCTKVAEELIKREAENIIFYALIKIIISLGPISKITYPLKNQEWAEAMVSIIGRKHNLPARYYLQDGKYILELSISGR